MRRDVGVDILDRRSFVENLIFQYRVMLASHGLTEMAAFAIDTSADPFDRELRAYLLEHAIEEEGHAQWLRNDLEESGAVVPSDADWLAAAVAGAQYYAIEHLHPAALLGYMLFLEGEPLLPEMIEKLEQTHGRTLLRTVRYHAEHDPAHRDELLRMLDRAPEAHHDLIRHSAFGTVAFWQAAMGRINTGSGAVIFNSGA